MDQPEDVPAEEGFHLELRRRVKTFLDGTGRPPRGLPSIYLKSAVLLGALAALYVLLVFAAATWWQAALLAGLLGLVMAGIGFNVAHDGSHGAFSSRGWVNRMAAGALDLLGGSSYVWRVKHNRLHHTAPNVVGMDDDIDVAPFGRLSPEQPRRWFHRLQHLYLWPLYGLLPMKWQLVDDFRAVAQGRVGPNPFPRPRGAALVVFVAGKAVFFALAIGIPALFHPLWVVLLFYAASSVVLGITLSVVFQLAHCVEEAEFPGAVDPETDWAKRQVRSTVDFSPGNRLLTWYLGGLNYQVEHHLFPRVSHALYPRLAPVVREVCAEHGVPHRVNASFGSAIRSHYRWLRRMGRPGA
jgi:linoleoyl-CoA desaturase